MKQVLLLFLGLVILGCNEQVPTELIEQYKQTAGELQDNGLYSAAVGEYQKILEFTTIDNGTRANINYLIGRLYFNDIKDYEQAAAYYIRARALDSEASFNTEASKNLISCLEKIGHSIDAQRALSKMTDVDATDEKPGEVKVAEINGEPVWLKDIENEIQTLPPQMQQQFTGRQGKVQYLQSYVGRELMYRAAKRENYDNDPEIIKRQRQLEKQLLVEKYVLDNVIPNIKIDSTDVMNFYKANQDELYNGAPFDSVKAQVFMDYQSEKTEAAFAEYINQMKEAQRVNIYEQNIR